MTKCYHFFAQRAPALVSLEACGGAHEWGRQPCSLGHEVRLLAPKLIRPLVFHNKTNAANARAMWTAVQQPGAHFVAVKTEQQQTALALHRMREQMMKFRIMQNNSLRGIIYEFGIVVNFPHGSAWCRDRPEPVDAYGNLV